MKIRVKLVIFAIHKLDGMVAISKYIPTRRLPITTLDEESVNSYSECLEMFSRLTGVDPQWGSLIFKQETVHEYNDDGEKMFDIVYSVYLEGMTSLKDDYDWMSLSEIDGGGIFIPDYELIKYLGSKRF